MNYINGHKITLRFVSEQITFFLNNLKKIFLLLIMFFAGKNSHNCNHSELVSIFFTLPFSISAIPSSRNFLFAGFPRRYSVSSFEASELSETVISRTLPLNIFLRPFIKSMLSSSFF